MTAKHDWTESTYEPGKPLEIDRIFKAAIKLNASDIHLQVGRPPVFRIRGTLRDASEPPIDEQRMIDLIFPMMDQRNLDIFHHDGGADFAKIVTVDEKNWRFRREPAHPVGQGRGWWPGRWSSSSPASRKLNLPPVMESLCKFDQGMVLLAGVTGFREEHDDRVDAELGQPQHAEAHPHDPRTRSSTCITPRSASSTSARSAWTWSTSRSP